MRCSKGRLRSTVQSITEKRNGLVALSVGRLGKSTAASAAGILAARPAAGTPRMNSRRSISGTEDFVTNVFEYVGGALHANRSGQDWIFILDAQNAFVADVHVRLNNGFPGGGSVSVADSSEGS